MKRLIIGTIICALALSVYSCAYKCVAVPSPGGYSYDQSPDKGDKGDKGERK